MYRNCFWQSEQFLYTTCSPHVLQKEELLTKIYLYQKKNLLVIKQSVFMYQNKSSKTGIHLTPTIYVHISKKNLKIESYLIWSRMSMVALCMIMHKILLMNFRLWVGFNKTCTINPDHYACTKPKAATESRIKLNTRRVCSTLGHPPTATENRDESWSLRTRAPDGRALVRTSMQPLSVCLLARQRLSRDGDCRRLTEKKNSRRSSMPAAETCYALLLLCSLFSSWSDVLSYLISCTLSSTSRI